MAEITANFAAKESAHCSVDWSTLTHEIRIVDEKGDRVLLHVDIHNVKKLIDGLSDARHALLNDAIVKKYSFAPPKS